MTQSSDDFCEDFDDNLLQAYINGKADVNNHLVIYRKENQIKHDSSLSNDKDLREELFRVKEELSFLRAKHELEKKKKKDNENRSNDQNNVLFLKNQLNEFKEKIEKLEDENLFLQNEVKTISNTRKKYKASKDVFLEKSLKNYDEIKEPEITLEKKKEHLIEKDWNKSDDNYLNIKNEFSSFVESLWNHSIPGLPRTTLNYLSKVCLDFDVDLGDLKIHKKITISLQLLDYLNQKKNCNWRFFFDDFLNDLMSLIEILVEKKRTLSVPFLISLIYCAINYRLFSLNEKTVENLIKKIFSIIETFSDVLNTNTNNFESDQNIVLKNLIFVFCFDLLEALVASLTNYSLNFFMSIFENIIFKSDLISKCLTDANESNIIFYDINISYNIISILSLFISNNNINIEKTRPYLDKILDVLFKFFFVFITIKNGFMFYGLNRIIGNHIDLLKIDALIPYTQNAINNTLVMLPQPIPDDLNTQNKENTDLNFMLEFNHNSHLLTLKLEITDFFKSIVLEDEFFNLLINKSYFRSMIQIIGIEQSFIMKFPRSKHIGLRLQIVSNFVIVIHFLIQKIKSISLITHPETMHELLVVILRIAFGSDSLSVTAYNFLLDFRKKGDTKSFVFNPTCELKLREINHVDFLDSFLDPEYLAKIESDHPNGLEFPYETNIIERSREILNCFVTREMAKNLYDNMNSSFQNDNLLNVRD